MSWKPYDNTTNFTECSCGQTLIRITLPHTNIKYYNKLAFKFTSITIFVLERSQMSKIHDKIYPNI